jgi:hypothetical protein
MAVYTVPQAFEGKTLAQVRDSTGKAFRPDTLAGYLGIQENTPLKAGQTFTYDVVDPGGGEYQALQSYFNPQSNEAYSATQATAAEAAAYKIAQERQNAAIDPAVKSLQAGVPETRAGYDLAEGYLKSQQAPLQQRYDNLLAQLTNQQNQSVKQSEISSAREMGKRGIATQSGYSDLYTQEKTEPINQYYTGQKANVGLANIEDQNTLAYQIAQNPIEEEKSIREILNAIAALQAGAGKDAITSGANSYQFGQQQSLAEKTLAQNLQIAQMEKDANDPYKKAQTEYYLALANGKISSGQDPGGLRS